MVGHEESICGGFLIARPAPRSESLSPTLLPETIFSASSCLADTLPDQATLAWGHASKAERRRLETIWAIPADRLSAIQDWANDAYADKRLLWRNLFPSLDGALDFLEWLEVEPDRAVILGIGLHPSQREEFLRVNFLVGQEAQIGLVEMIRGGHPMPVGGCFLGWEILGFEYDGAWSHSWLCNGLEVEFHDRLGIRPNEYGLIGDWDQAVEAASLCNDPEIGAEPVGWWAWAIVKYAARRSRDGACFVEEEPKAPLSDRDRDQFLAMLDDPPAPNEALKRAFARHAKGRG